MTQKEILENNKLIAVFDGWKEINNSINGDFYKKDKGWILKQHLQYNFSYNWLMSVFEKIELLRFSYTISGLHGKTHYCWFHKYDEEGIHELQPIGYNGKLNEILLIVLYKAVIKFIKWYNENN